MIPHSPLLEDAIRYSTTMDTVVDVYLGDMLTYPDIPVVSGTVTSDRDSKVRWACQLEVALEPWIPVDITAAYSARIAVYRGLTSLGRTEMLQLGEYRIDSVGRTDSGTISIAASGLESYVVDARFLTPRVPPFGQSTLQAITDLITESVPVPVRVEAQNTTDRRVQATAPWDRDRIDAVLALGESIGADVYADHDGTFVIRDKPTVSGRVPVFLVNQDRGGVIIGRDVQNTRDGVYNAVVATGQSTDQTVPPVWGWAYDSDPASPTYFYGPFGQKPRFYSSQYLYTDQQAADTARTMLAEAMAVNRTLTFQALPIIFLEAGDVVAVQLADGTVENHLLQKTAVGLSHDGTLTADTFANPLPGDVVGP